MNKKSLILAASALALVLSCNVKEEALPLPQKVTFQAVMADASPTKTELQSDGSVFWSPGDAINLFYGDAVSEKMVYDSTATVAAQASFTGTLPTGFAPNGKDEFWAVYPYSKDNVFDGSSVTLTLPDWQPSVSGTFADDLFISLARSTGYELSFYNLCGGIKFRVTTPGITRVSFYGHQEEYLAGKVKVGFDENGKPLVQEVLEGSCSIHLDSPSGGFEVGKWYYMVALPTTLSMGYTMSFFQDGNLVSERSVETPVAIKRSIWGRITDADKVEAQVSNFLTFSSRGTTTVSLTNIGDNAPVLYYSTDAQTWTQWDYSALTVSADAPLYICGDNPQGFGTGNSSFRMSGDNVAVSGDIMSLINKDQAVTVIPSASCFYGLFYQCSALVSAPELPATTLTEYCYYNMFYGCSNLIEAPELPATTLAPWCYGQMFAACTSLVTAPYLPAETLVNACYYHMFQNSTSLEHVTCMATDISADEATTTWLEDVAATGTFVKAPNSQWPIGSSGIPEGWTVVNEGEEQTTTVTASKYLTFTSEGTTTVSMSNEGNNAPVLYYSTDAQHWTLWDYGEIVSYADAPLYICGDNPDGFSTSSSDYSMFTSEGDSFAVSGDIMSLINYSTDVLDIPCPYCFFMLFGGNSILTSGPELPATGLTESCYSSMYASCINLASAPVFPAATTLAPFCYQNMFFRCSNLVEAPALPFTTLAEYCYHSMFYYSGLKEAPVLPATVLVTGCYINMFYGCTELASVKCLATDISAMNGTLEWLNSVSSTGVFIKDANTQWPTGISGIPEGWTVEIEGAVTAGKYLTLTSDGTTKVLLENYNGNDPILYYSFDKDSWNLWDYGELSFSAGEPLYLCGDNPKGFSQLNYKYSKFVTSGDTFAVSGDVMSLINKDLDVYVLPSSGCFQSLFEGCEKMTAAPDLPATTITYYCYKSMFSGCFSLVLPPDLPAVSLAGSCYMAMFEGCSSLSEAPVLAATEMMDNCYYKMFYGCSSLTTTPLLPATTLAQNCYAFMFSGCSGLTLPPALQATAMEYGCYSGMFNECSNLLEAPELPSTSLADNCYSTMFRNCSSLTSAPVLPAITMMKSCYSDMFSNCTGFTTAPELPATILAESCYENMFNGCTGLLSAPSLPATALDNKCYAGMFMHCYSLTAAPELPAVTLAQACYQSMFAGSGLTNAPVLPATTLADSCYYFMFSGCDGLTQAPALPATTLSPGCYSQMFRNCINLESAPELPALTLVQDCYNNMFYYCSNLNYIKCLATEISATDSLTDWVINVSSQGTFVKAPNTQWPIGSSGIPEGWTVEDAQ